MPDRYGKTGWAGCVTLVIPLGGPKDADDRYGETGRAGCVALVIPLGGTKMPDR